MSTSGYFNGGKRGMGNEPLSVKLRRNRRNAGENWKHSDEEEWQKQFPGDAKPEWMKSNPDFTFFDEDLLPEIDRAGAPDWDDPGILAVQ